MFDRILVATGEKGQVKALETLAGMLLDRLGIDAPVTPCRDVESLAAARAPRGRGDDLMEDLIIIDEKLPVDREDLQPGRAGFDYVAALQRSERPAACILIGAVSDAIIVNEVARFQRCRLLGLSGELGNLLDPLENYARQLAPPTKNGAMRGPAARDPRKWALLEFNLRGKRDSTVTLYMGDGVSTYEPDSRPFQLDVGRLRRIINRSREMRQQISAKLADAGAWNDYMASWEKDYAALGADVFRLINQDRFPYLWGRAVEAADSNVRIRFTVSEEAYDCLWESIYDDRDDGDWLIAHGGVARRARLSSPQRHGRNPLDGGDGIINVLAVFSNITPGTLLVGPDDAGWNKLKQALLLKAQDAIGRRPQVEQILPVLRTLDEEETCLQQLMQLYPKRFRVKVISSVDASTSEGLVDRVRQELAIESTETRRKYDIVHFAGHALFNDEIDGRGYLIFGDRGSTEAVPVATFARWLQGAEIQLAYLSCCQSSASRAAFQVANSGVPLAIGFAYDLDSKKAAVFAKTFYGLLVKDRFPVCQAVHEARQRLRNEHYRFDPTWTAPVLVAQPDRWEWVETCFSPAEHCV